MSLRKLLMAGSVALAGTMMLAGASSAATLPVPSQPAAQFDVNGSGGEQVQYRRHGERRWNHRYHGPRFRHQRPGWGHYHGGYWYRTPWWTLPLIVPPVVTAPSYGYGNAHVQWCSQRYRSYNPATDQFLGYDGLYHRCNSPY